MSLRRISPSATTVLEFIAVLVFFSLGLFLGGRLTESDSNIVLAPIKTLGISDSTSSERAVVEKTLKADNDRGKHRHGLY